MSEAAVAASASRRRIFGATAAALAVAGAVLVTVVLPAEYGVDPLGTGAAFGLLALAEPPRQALKSSPAVYCPDAATFELQPFESVEYKYRLEEGDTLVFTWHADGELVSELHAEPDGAREGYAKSFDQQRAVGANGSYRAPFPGWHGWFWENRSMDVATLTVATAGFFSAARTYRGGHVWEEPSSAAPGSAPGGCRAQ